MFKVIAWHKLTSDNQDTPLIVNNITISDHLEKAGALRGEVLNRYTAEDDLRHNNPPFRQGSYSLSFTRERDLASTLVFFFDTEDDSNHVPALYVEENPE
jgi:hypothetical protein